MPELRQLAWDDLREPMDQIGQFEISDDERAERGLPLVKRAWEDGLGYLIATGVELSTGEQFWLARFDHGPTRVNMSGSALRDAHDNLRKLRAALDLPTERVTWEVPVAASAAQAVPMSLERWPVAVRLERIV